ncbi:MAG: hypothetical protein LBR00_07035 [Clostridiales Family XIII bacterium]|jgi:hypothetical protein|nr:hypothetical protein [Clostridiales Family XIII bacterium]
MKREDLKNKDWDADIAAALTLDAVQTVPEADVAAFTREASRRLAAASVADGIEVSPGGAAAVERRPSRVWLLVVLIAAVALVLALLYFNLQGRGGPTDLNAGLNEGIYMEVIPADKGSAGDSAADDAATDATEGRAGDSKNIQENEK